MPSWTVTEDGRSKIQNEEGIIHIDWGGALAVVWWQEECL